MFKCSFCNNEYTTKSSLNRHQKTVKKCLSNNEKIEEYKCNNKRELEFREEQLRVELKATLNSNRCWRDGKCEIDECENNVQNNGVCISHGATVKTCKTDGCDKQPKKNGMCIKHFNELNTT